jgi:Family of unknown function (DUF5872)
MSKTAERTHPELWEKVKAELRDSEKGGKAGEWSARKAQLAVQEYKKRGGGYSGRKSEDNSLKQWTEEEWGTKSGKPSGETGERYLPERAREALTDEEYRGTTAKKRADTAKGKQLSKQPEPIAVKTARFRHEAKSEPPPPPPSKADLLRQAKMLEIDGRSRMNKEDLAKAIRYAKH